MAEYEPRYGDRTGRLVGGALLTMSVVDEALAFKSIDNGYFANAVWLSVAGVASVVVGASMLHKSKEVGTNIDENLPINATSQDPQEYIQVPGIGSVPQQPYDADGPYYR